LISYPIKENKHFIGREKELAIIKKINQQTEAQILICYGRRRVGKTELIEQAFRKYNVLKFEGLQGKNHDDEIQHFLEQLANYVGDAKIALLKFTTWKQCFELLAEYTQKGIWTVYLEELQWMACYQSDLISELKYVWDNFFKKNPNLRLVLCGSATSFILTNVVKSQALYNRSQTVLELKELSIQECRLLFENKHSLLGLMDIYLCFGGIPEYLKKLKNGPSLLLNACSESFVETGFFHTEIDRIFVSQFSNRKNYKSIIDFLSQRKFSSRDEILKHLGITSGGKLSEIIEDLMVCRFIDAQSPLSFTSTKKANSKLLRYQVSDPYLRFYYKFIRPKSKAIERGQFEKVPLNGLNLTSWRKWLGFAFEYWCLKNSVQIAQALGFSDVEYDVGPYYNRATEKIESGYQIDLLFDRADNVLSVCEIKYTERPVGKEIISEFEHKLELLVVGKRKTIQKVLISAAGAKPELRNYFDRIITLEDIL